MADETQADVERWRAFAERLLLVGERIFFEGETPVTNHGAADPRVVAVLLLIRTISHLRGILVLARSDLAVEARMLARSCFENLFYVAALREKGAKFVIDMKRDELASRHARGEFLMQVRSRQSDPQASQKLRALLKRWAKEDRKYLNVKGIALSGVTANSYLYYAQLSADAGHPTFTSLDRYLVSGDEPEAGIRAIDFNPPPDGQELPETLAWACEAVIGVCVATNEMLGHTPASPDLDRLVDEYASLTRGGSG